MEKSVRYAVPLRLIALAGETAVRFFVEVGSVWSNVSVTNVLLMISDIKSTDVVPVASVSIVTNESVLTSHDRPTISCSLQSPVLSFVELSSKLVPICSVADFAEAIHLAVPPACVTNTRRFCPFIVAMIYFLFTCTRKSPES